MEEQSEYVKLPSDAKKAWRIIGGIWSIFFWVPPGYFLVARFYGIQFSVWTIVAAALGALLLTLLIVLVIPEIRWRQWQYRVDEHEIDLQYGIFIIKRTLVPVKRVQHVDTRQGPVLRQYNLADVVISTAATTHRIPALSEGTADEARSEISTFARKAKEDV